MVVHETDINRSLLQSDRVTPKRPNDRSRNAHPHSVRQLKENEGLIRLQEQQNYLKGRFDPL